MGMTVPRILVADDEEYVRAFFRGILKPESYRLRLASDGQETLDLWSREEFDLIIMDIRMPRLSGMEVLRRIRSADDRTMIIMISAYGDMDSVIEAMRLGANDFFAKPFTSVDKIRLDIDNCLERLRLKQENKSLKARIDLCDNSHEIVYASRAMANVIETARRAAQFDSPVLIHGESGTGKELIARFIHRQGARKDRPFLAVNCGAVPETLLEHTLFGYEKGAFTGAHKTTAGYFETAHGGTIFLDEIGETPPSFQIKLLRVLQEGEIMRVGGSRVIKVDNRVISATSKDLTSLVKEGLFRKDLFYRINVVRIEVPPLRKRPEDIPVLVQHFLEKLSAKNGLKGRKLSPELVSHLSGLKWEGNVRELENLVEYLLVISPSKVVGMESLPPELKASVRTGNSFRRLNYEDARYAFERGFVEALFEETGGDIKQAARISGLDLSTLYRKKKYFLKGA